MAEIIRQDYHLPTLLISMQFINREPHIQIGAYHGRQELVVQSIPTTDVGIRERLSVGAYRGVQFDLPEAVVAALEHALNDVRRDEPVWLQIDRAAGYLAAVPWERLLARAMRGPFLRIPNFLVDPAIIKGPLALVICASAPVAKEFYSAYDFTSALIESVQGAVVQGSEVHLFTDRSAYSTLQERFHDRNKGRHRVTIYDPEKAIPYGRGDSEISGSEKLRSPWLRWMDAELEDHTIDAVHFVCPGYFQTDRGSLALARSPMENEDEAWYHFVGGAELCAFLNDLGAGAVVLGAPYEDIWALGLRLLADELAWTRPGPVMLYETQSNLAAVSQAYAFLFSEDYIPPPKLGELLLYCHPRQLERFLEWTMPNIESPTLSTGHPGHEWLYHTMNVVARKPGRAALRGVAAPEPPPPEPRWARVNRLAIEQSLFDISGQHGAAARGTADALRFVSQLQAKFLAEEE